MDVVRAHLSAIQVDLDSKIGLLSFTSTPHEPTLWSHYAESHMGIALGFDISPNSLVLERLNIQTLQNDRHSSAQSKPLCLDGLRPQNTHDQGFGMEGRIRISRSGSFRLSGCRSENDNFFVPMSDHGLVLVEAILGCKCSSTRIPSKKS